MSLINYTPPADGETADAADVVTPLNTIYNEFNGNIDNSNIKSAAAISTSKLADDAGITTAKIADGAITPAKKAQYIASGSFTTDTGTGNKAITGLGFTPKFVEFHWFSGASATAQSNAIGWMTSTGQFAQWGSSNAAANQSVRNSYSDRCFAIGSAASSTSTDEGAYVSMDSDGFTINVTKANSQTWHYVAFG